MTPAEWNGEGSDPGQDAAGTGGTGSAREELLQLRSALTVAEKRFETVVETTADYAIIGIDVGGIITLWNKAAEDVVGWRPDEVLGHPFSTLFTPEDRATGVPERELGEARALGRTRDERWHMRGDGSRFFACGELNAIRRPDGTLDGYLKILRDDSGQIRYRSELKRGRERLALALEVSALVGTWDWDILSDTIYTDSRFASFYGIDPRLAETGAPLSAFLEGVHPEDRARIAEEIARTVERGGTFSSKYRVVDRLGTVRWVKAEGFCFYDTAGRAVRFPGAVVDATQEHARERRQMALLRLGDELAQKDESFNPTRAVLTILGETMGVARAGYASLDLTSESGLVLDEWTAPGLASLTGRADLGPLVRALSSRLDQGVLALPDAHGGEAAEIGAYFQCGAILAMTVLSGVERRTLLYLGSDRPRDWGREEVDFVRELLDRAWIHEQRRRTAKALESAEMRLRLAHEAAAIGAFDYDLRTDVLEWDDRCRAAFGVSPGGPVNYEETFRKALHPEDRARIDAAVETALAGNGAYDVVYRTIGIEDGLERFVHARGQVLMEDGRAVRFIGAVRDVTEERRSQEHQKLLTRELQHRVKNTLAMVSALASQTMRRAASTQEGLAAFSARLEALGHAHDILTQTSWASAPIAAVVENALRIHIPNDEGRVTWSGPRQLTLNARQALSLSLALHELATNATKYGALSNDAGRVAVEWRIDGSEGSARNFTFVWQERDGPNVAPPQQRGFGSRLIEQSLAAEFGGTVSLDFWPEGLLCRMEAVLGDGSPD